MAIKVFKYYLLRNKVCAQSLEKSQLFAEKSLTRKIDFQEHSYIWMYATNASQAHWYVLMNRLTLSLDGINDCLNWRLKKCCDIQADHDVYQHFSKENWWFTNPRSFSWPACMLKVMSLSLGIPNLTYNASLGFLKLTLVVLLKWLVIKCQEFELTFEECLSLADHKSGSLNKA